MRIGRKFAVGLLYCLGACAIAAAVSIGIDVWRSDALFSGLAPLRMRFADVNGSELASPFTAAWSAAHEVSLVFPTPVNAPALRQAVESAGASDGATSPYPPFDFEWRVVEGNKPVGFGSGRNRPSSVSRAPGIVALGFGTFQAQAGHAYVLRMSFGAESDQYRSAKMEVEVAVAEPGPSVGLAWVRDLGPIAVWFLALVGGVLLALAVALTLR